MLPNGVELSCPAEVGRLTRIMRPASWHRKRHQRPGPPGQLQQVVGRRQILQYLYSPSQLAFLSGFRLARCTPVPGALILMKSFPVGRPVGLQCKGNLLVKGGGAIGVDQRPVLQAPAGQVGVGEEGLPLSFGFAKKVAIPPGWPMK